MTISDKLKQKIVKEIVEDFLSTEDVADALMALATELTETIITTKSSDLFSEISGMVAYKLGGIMLMGFSQSKASLKGGVLHPVESDNLPEGFNLGPAQDVIDGHIDSLYSAFPFGNTPQGSRYWDDRASGTQPLSQSDLDCIREWVKIAQTAEKGE